MDLSDHFLIAAPHLDDPTFQRSVCYIIEHSASGVVGVIINAATQMSVGELLEQFEIPIAEGQETAMQAPVLYGGPVHTERGMVLHDGGAHWDASCPLAPGIWLSCGRDILHDIGRGAGPPHSLIVLGCAGWGTRQLDQELRQYSWLSGPARAEVLFQCQLEERLQQASLHCGFDYAQISPDAGHA